MKSLSELFFQEVNDLMVARKCTYEEAFSLAQVFHRSLFAAMNENPQGAATSYTPTAQELLHKEVTRLQGCGHTYEGAHLLARTSNRAIYEEVRRQGKARSAVENAAVGREIILDPFFPRVPAHLKKLVGLENATQFRWSEALANARDMSPDQASKLFTGLVSVIQEQGRPYAEAWSDATNLYPAVFLRLCENSGPKSAVRLGRKGEYLTPTKHPTLAALKVLGLPQDAQHDQYRIWLAASQHPLSYLIAAQAIVSLVQFQQIEKGKSFKDAFQWVKQQKPELFAALLENSGRHVSEAELAALGLPLDADPEALDIYKAATRSVMSSSIAARIVYEMVQVKDMHESPQFAPVLYWLQAHKPEISQALEKLKQGNI